MFKTDEKSDIINCNWIFFSCKFGDNKKKNKIENCRVIHLLDTTYYEIKLSLVDSACSNYVLWTIHNKTRIVDLKNDLGLDWVNEIDTYPFQWETADFFCIRFGCGMPCWNDVIFPINKDIKPIVAYNTLWHNSEFVVASSKSSDYILIYKLNNGQIIDSIDSPINMDKSWNTYGGGEKTYNIDSVNIYNDTLFLGKFDEDYKLIRSLKRKIKNGA